MAIQSPPETNSELDWKNHEVFHEWTRRRQLRALKHLYLLLDTKIDDIEFECGKELRKEIEANK